MEIIWIIGICVFVDLTIYTSIEDMYIVTPCFMMVAFLWIAVFLGG